MINGIQRATRLRDRHRSEVLTVARIEGESNLKAAVCRTFGAPLTVEEVSLADPTEGELEVTVKAVAICHSDLAYASGIWGGDLPAVYGHEAAGLVSKIGTGVSSFKVGDPVCVTLIRSCGSCRACSRGQVSECAQPWDKSGSPISGDGGEHILRAMNCGAFAERVVIHQSQCAALPKGVPFDTAALISCGVLTGAGAVVNTANVQAGDRVAVIGVGGVGLNTIQAAALTGASTVIAIDLLEDKRAAALEFGATHALDGGASDLPAQVQALTDGLGVEFVFVTVGAASAYAGAPDLLTRGGAVVAVGMPAVGTEVPYSPVDMADRSIRLLGSSMGQSHVQRDIPWLVDLYKQGRLKLDELISGRWQLDQINEAFEDTRSGRARRNVILFD